VDDARRQHQRVDSTELALGRCDDGRDVGGARDVEPHRHEPGVVRVCARELVVGDVGEHDARAEVGQATRDREPEARCTAGDQRLSAGKDGHVSSAFWRMGCNSCDTLASMAARRS
jgi:hypothetical protein